ncbi:hypothetical protein [Pelagibacterium limicola]|uniref:hypothetical protein n=1 Tax=Pelagibacterium limicola TaxID=2791022 RepID=UPI0018AFFB60|nr:hypothetical protein [Pelagibacterium limicola]
MTASRPVRFPWKLHLVIVAVIVLVPLLPVISVIIASIIAETNGCRLDEAGSYPCVVMGRDLGSLLAVMFVLGWFALATLPLGATGLAIWLVGLLAHLVYHHRRRFRSGLRP